MSILSKLFTPIVRGYNAAMNNVTEEVGEKKAYEAKLATATGLDGILDAVTAEKKSRKEKQERKALREEILNI